MADDRILETERLLLRRFRDTDLPRWQAHMNTPEVRKHLGKVESDEEIARRFRRFSEAWSETGGGWLAVIRRADVELLGNCGFGPIEAATAPAELRGRMEIGWQLRSDCWGRGYATEAARAVLAMIFARGDAPVYAQTSEANRGSWRVMERLGMERLEHLDYDDPAYPPEENPTKVYGLTREAWRAMQTEETRA